jgi:hypothetical protein
MSDLLDTVFEAHGGLERWNQLDTVSARLIQGGVLWPFKGQGHAAETQWSTLQLAYFVGTAMWTDLTQPFSIDLSEIAFA